jgi:hypothetical protein
MNKIKHPKVGGAKKNKNNPTFCEHISFHLQLKCILLVEHVNFIHKQYLSRYQMMWTLFQMIPFRKYFKKILGSKSFEL